MLDRLNYPLSPLLSVKAKSRWQGATVVRACIQRAFVIGSSRSIILTAKETLLTTSARLLLPIMVACLCLASSTSGAQSGDAAVIDKFIASQAEKQAGSEPDGIRKVMTGDLNHDGVADAAVLFTI